MASFRLGRVPDAVKHYEQALRLKPDYVNAHINLGTALLQLGRAREAAEECQQALRFKPDSADAFHNLGKALLQLGRVAEAVQRAERACELTANGVASYLDTLGVAYAAAGRFAEAGHAAELAATIALAAGDKDLAAQIQSRLELYRAGRAYSAVPGGAGP